MRMFGSKSHGLLIMCALLGFAARVEAQSPTPDPHPRCAVCEHEISNQEHTRTYRGRTIHLCSNKCATAWDEDNQSL